MTYMTRLIGHIECRRPMVQQPRSDSELLVSGSSFYYYSGILQFKVGPKSICSVSYISEDGSQEEPSRFQKMVAKGGNRSHQPKTHRQKHTLTPVFLVKLRSINTNSKIYRRIC